MRNATENTSSGQRHYVLSSLVSRNTRFIVFSAIQKLENVPTTPMQQHFEITKLDKIDWNNSDTDVCLSTTVHTKEHICGEEFGGFSYTERQHQKCNGNTHATIRVRSQDEIANTTNCKQMNNVNHQSKVKKKIDIATEFLIQIQNPS